MSVSPEVQQFINKSLADNNKALLDQISKLVADSADNVKRASVEAADEQLREIKKLRREELKSFKQKGNELQYKFNAKLQESFEEAKSHLEVNAIDKAKETLAERTSSLVERQKLILLAGKSDFGWKTVDEYVEHELAVDEEDGKKIRSAEERAEKAVKSTVCEKGGKAGYFFSFLGGAVRSVWFPSICWSFSGTSKAPERVVHSTFLSSGAISATQPKYGHHSPLAYLNELKTYSAMQQN